MLGMKVQAVPVGEKENGPCIGQHHARWVSSSFQLSLVLFVMLRFTLPLPDDDGDDEHEMTLQLQRALDDGGMG